VKVKVGRRKKTMEHEDYTPPLSLLLLLLLSCRVSSIGSILHVLFSCYTLSSCTEFVKSFSHARLFKVLTIERKSAD
jgi:hypothetical protein